jgi:hypothetical protein
VFDVVRCGVSGVTVSGLSITDLAQVVQTWRVPCPASNAYDRHGDQRGRGFCAECKETSTRLQRCTSQVPGPEQSGNYMLHHPTPRRRARLLIDPGHDVLQGAPVCRQSGTEAFNHPLPVLVRWTWYLVVSRHVKSSSTRLFTSL